MANLLSVGAKQSFKIDLQSSEAERRLGIRRVDWLRIKTSVSKVKTPLPHLSFWYSALIGVAVSSGLSIIPLCHTTGLPAWVVPLYACITASSLIMASVFYWLERELHRYRNTQVDGVVQDMVELEKHFFVEVETPPTDQSGN